MARKKFFILGTLFLIVCLSVGCSRSFEVIRDIRELPQDHRFYLLQGAVVDLAPLSKQGEWKKEYDRNYFAPWHQEQAPYGKAETQGFFERYVTKIDTKGRKKGGRSVVKRLVANAQLNGYPNAAVQAITVCRTDMRGLPANRVLPLKKTRKGKRDDGFDRLQVSSIPVNTPVFIAHYSKDRKWCLIDAGFAFGWVMRRDLATVDAGFVKEWENGTYVSLIKDGVPVSVHKKRYFKASIGSMFPKAGESDHSLDILVAVTGKNGQAVIRTAHIQKTQAVCRPYAMTSLHMAELANELIDNPYGWGGKDGKRDCSSMIRDLFEPFGLWLPRHSADQANESGYLIDLSGKTREEKQAAIVAQGVPYLTLLWLKGHIMLYVGTLDGVPLVFHNFWSIRMTDAEGRKTKKIIGRTTITTLHPGREFQPPGSVRGDFLEAVQGMTLLIQPSTAAAIRPGC
ncbi:MAG: hypothetical protein CSYNP_03296 [Syntrophus sp. SKADARSKE-3]|nr:hypothetical protein [Syntrophus sp. SKADARSKE-3]